MRSKRSTSPRRGDRDLASGDAWTGAVAVPVAGVDVPTFYHRISDVRAASAPTCRSRADRRHRRRGSAAVLEPRWQQLPRSVRGVVRGSIAGWLRGRRSIALAITCCCSS